MSSNVETVALGFTTRLRYAYWIATTVVLVGTVMIMLYGPAAGAVLWNEVVEERFISWPYMWFWGQSLGFFTPVLTLWLMSHNWFGAYYAVHLVLTLVATAVHVVFAIFVVDVFVTCSPRFCDGAQPIAALNPKFGTAPDIGLWAYTGIVGALFLCDVFFLLFNYYLHRKTEFRTQLEVAAASRAPDTARSYMYRSQHGGARSLFDAFSPPGMHAYGSFSPSTGGAQRVRQAISADASASHPLVGADIIAQHAGSPPPTLDGLYSCSPWSLLSHGTEGLIGSIFAPRYPSPAEQFAAKGYAVGDQHSVYSPLPVATASPPANSGDGFFSLD